MKMINFKLSEAPIGIKLFASVLHITVGLVYMSLLVQIWIDTEMQPSLIGEAYGGMEYIELTNHAHTFLPYYAIYIFTFPVLIFMFTSYSEKIKKFLAVFPFVVIVIDIASMFLIPYLWQGFAWILFFAGIVLGLTFLLLFILNLYDIWFRKLTY